jgi:hypothetical protein
MKYKAKYDAESDVPQELKDLYKLEGGKWVFHGEEFEGLAELLNPALATNKENILNEKRIAVEAKKLAEDKVTDLENQIAVLQKPGTVAIAADEHKQFEEYKALGAPKDITQKLETAEQISVELQTVKTKDEVRTLAKQLGVNEEALVDFKMNYAPAKDLKLSTITRKEKDQMGKELEKKLLAVTVSSNVDGKAQEKVTEFSEYATQNNFPTYLVDAIFNTTTKQEPQKKSFRTAASMSTKTESPDNGTTAKSKSQSFNERRSTRQLPWSAKQKSE